MIFLSISYLQYFKIEFGFENKKNGHSEYIAHLTMQEVLLCQHRESEILTGMNGLLD